MAGVRPKRLRWRKLFTIALMAYFAVWLGRAGLHYWTLRGEERSIEVKIAAVRKENQTLQRNVRALHNPKALRSMLTGKEALPRPEFSQ